MKLIHCMKEKEFLENTLRNGFYPKKHPVELTVSQNNHPVYTEVFSMLLKKLEDIGTPYINLPSERKDIMCWSVSNIKSKAPMVCFTELMDGRDLHYHRLQFGSFGVVVDSSWVERNGGDRVIYFGDNSEFSVRLFKALATLRIRGIWVNAAGLPNPNTDDLDLMIEMLAYFEHRSHISEQEWRIAGKCQTTMNNIRINISEIETIYLPNDEWMAHFQQIVNELANQQGARRIPEVTVFPDNIPISLRN